MASVNHKILAQAQPGTSDTLLYTASTEVAIDGAIACNPTGTARDLTVALVKGGGALAAANTVHSAVAIGAGSTTTLAGLVNQRMESGDEIRALATAATAITVTISGREITG